VDQVALPTGLHAVLHRKGLDFLIPLKAGTLQQELAVQLFLLLDAGADIAHLVAEPGLLDLQVGQGGQRHGQGQSQEDHPEDALPFHLAGGKHGGSTDRGLGNVHGTLGTSSCRRSPMRRRAEREGGLARVSSSVGAMPPP